MEVRNVEFRKKVGDLGQVGIPTSAAFEVTHRCNARCAYCYQRFSPRQPDLPLEKVKMVIDRLADSGVMFLLITGGEPFVRPDILDILEHAVSKEFFWISVFTNATLLNEEHIRWLIAHKNNIQYVKCSIFSHLHEINDGYFGVKDATRLILSNTRRLKDAGMKVRLTTVAIEENIEHFDMMMSSLSGNGIELLATPLKTVVSNEHYELLKNAMTYSFFERYFKCFPRKQYAPIKRRLQNAMAAKSLHDSMCLGRMNEFAVGPQGSIMPCLNIRGVNLGSILQEKPLREILEASAFRKEFMKLRRRDIKQCSSCRFINFCELCPAGNYNLTGNLCELIDRQYCNYAEALYRI